MPPVILKEPFTRKEAYAAITSFIGVILIAQPSFLFGHPTEIDPTAGTHHHNVAGSAGAGIVPGIGGSGQHHIEPSEKMRLIAVGFSLLGVIGASLAYTSVRRLRDSTHVMHNIIYFTAWSLILSTLSSVLSGTIPGLPESSKIVWVWPDFTRLMGVIAIGIFGFTGQVLLTMGFQREFAGRATLALYLAIIFSLISERIFFHHHPGFLSFVGIAIILSSATYVALSKKSGVPAPTTPKGDEEVGSMSIGSASEGDDGEATQESGRTEAHGLK
ncbi:hypothetical protein FRC05_008275 [Tulasnella sp. 425]|nr:hypothetical protein FRC05_008275 [Tulasnella sp. 425]